jgi:hypothetical protein
VAYRLTAGQEINGMATVALQRHSKYAFITIELLLSKQVPTATVMHATGEMGYCLHGPCRGVTKRRELQQLIQLSSAREAKNR